MRSRQVSAERSIDRQAAIEGMLHHAPKDMDCGLTGGMFIWYTQTYKRCAQMWVTTIRRVLRSGILPEAPCVVI